MTAPDKWPTCCGTPPDDLTWDSSVLPMQQPPLAPHDSLARPVGQCDLCHPNHLPVHCPNPPWRHHQAPPHGGRVKPQLSFCEAETPSSATLQTWTQRLVGISHMASGCVPQVVGLVQRADSWARIPAGASALQSASHPLHPRGLCSAPSTFRARVRQRSSVLGQAPQTVSMVMSGAG